MHTRRIIFLFGLALMVQGCLHPSPQTKLTESRSVAEQFKSKAGANRIAEGKQMVELLPTCPLVVRGWFDQVEWNDWEHPSYKFPRDNLFQMFGQPDHYFQLGAFSRQYLEGKVTRPPSYQIGPAAFATYDLGRDASDAEWELVIILYNNYIVASRILDKDMVEGSKTFHGKSMLMTNNLP